MTNETVGRNEPGWDKMRSRYRKTGASEESLLVYARALGAVRNLSPKPLLELSADELETLDEELVNRAPMLRTILRMFYTSNKRGDLAVLIVRRRHATRRLGFDDVLMPSDVVAILRVTTNARDRAIVATLAATGARVNEVLALRIHDLKSANGSYQAWFGKTKVKSQERFSPKIEGEFKKVLDDWLAVHPVREPNAWLFPNAGDVSEHPARKTLESHIKTLAEMAGITKPVNPHAFRHARVTWGVINKEDAATLSQQIWGKPMSNMMNRYTHFSGLDTTVEMPHDIVLPPVPAMPVIPDFAGKRLEALNARIAALEKGKPIRTVADLDERATLEEQRVQLETARMSKGEMEARVETEEMAERLAAQQVEIDELKAVLAKVLRAARKAKKADE